MKIEDGAFILEETALAHGRTRRVEAAARYSRDGDLLGVDMREVVIGPRGGRDVRVSGEPDDLRARARRLEVIASMADRVGQRAPWASS